MTSRGASMAIAIAAWLAIPASSILGCSSKNEASKNEASKNEPSKTESNGSTADPDTSKVPNTGTPKTGTPKADSLKPDASNADTKAAPLDPHASRMLTKADTRGQFGVGPGYVYWCDDGVVRGAPKNGDREVTLGTCEGSFQFLGDQHGMYWCSDHTIYRGKPGSTAAAVAAVEGCILAGIDNTDLYFIVPGFEGIPDPGLYKLSRAGGDPTRILPTAKGEQISVALEGDDVWIAYFGAGIVQKLKKAGGKPVTVISGQRGPIDLGVDDKYVYWLVQQGNEVRRRLKAGGAIETVGTDVGSRLIVQGKFAYWTDGNKPVIRGEPEPPPTARLMRLAQGAKAAEPALTKLLVPQFEVDADGLYVVDDQRNGVLFVPN